MNRIAGAIPVYKTGMATNGTLLCIHRDPAQLTLLQENGYDVVAANNGHDGLQFFRSQPVDAIVLEYHLGLLDGAVIATAIKQVRPGVPIIMLTDNLELPDGALKSVDALVDKSDGGHFLLTTIHFLLTVKPARRHVGKLSSQMPVNLRRPGRSGEGAARWPGNTPQLAMNAKDVPSSPRAWRVRNGTVQF